MKKFLIFMLVLGMTSVASADYIRLELDSGTIGAGETIILGLVSDLETAGFNIHTMAEMDALGNQVDMGGAITDVGGDSAVYDHHSNMSIQGDGFIHNYQGALFAVVTGFVSTTAVPPLTPSVKFEYTIDAAWDGTEYTVGPLAEGKTYTWSDSASLTAQESYGDVTGPDDLVIGGLTIPEPMTIALLGLGSLFLLRRRR
jgi:hypothetical protein